MEKIQPHHYDCILFQAGVDPLEEDALGRLALLGWTTPTQRASFPITPTIRLPVVIFMGGGYARPIELNVDAFEDLFTVEAKYTV